jgi:hypothetical protein
MEKSGFSSAVKGTDEKTDPRHKQTTIMWNRWLNFMASPLLL